MATWHVSAVFIDGDSSRIPRNAFPHPASHGHPVPAPQGTLSGEAECISLPRSLYFSSWERAPVIFLVAVLTVLSSSVSAREMLMS